MMEVFAALAAATLVGWRWSEYERGHFVTESCEVITDRLAVGERTYVFLTDLHNREFGPGNRDLIEAIDRIGPDAVLAGGDIMTCKGKREIGPAFGLLAELAGRYPVYHGYGNHESRMDDQRGIYGDQHDRYVRRLEERGVMFLRNRSVTEPEGVRVTGIELDGRFYRKFGRVAMPEGYIRSLVGQADEGTFQILLAHSPLYMEEYADWGAGLVLSGHFHGGTIRLPLLGGVMTPQFQFFLPWCAGEFEQDGCRMVVGRGLGTHSINIRINNRPQLLVLRLKNPAKAG